jgi:hypothetical protein
LYKEAKFALKYPQPCQPRFGFELRP